MPLSKTCTSLRQKLIAESKKKYKDVSWFYSHWLGDNTLMKVAWRCLHEGRLAELFILTFEPLNILLM
jgi:hypothetical protein